MLADIVITTTEVRRHNGACAYGDWMPLEEAMPHVREAVADEVLEKMFFTGRPDLYPARLETAENTEKEGEVTVGGAKWLYRR